MNSRRTKMSETYSENFRENCKNVNIKNLAKTGKYFGKFYKTGSGEGEKFRRNVIKLFK